MAGWRIARTSEGGRVRRLQSFAAALAFALALAGLSSAAAWGETSGTVENENGVVTATCSSVSITYRNFPNVPNNVVTQALTIHGVAISTKKITFNGTTGTNVVPIVVPPGAGMVDDHATWNTNGFRGHFDLGVLLECPAEPSYSITKVQKIDGTKSSFTSSPLTGKVGQTVDYQIVVKNTGNVGLTLSNFIDEQCGPVSGGPGSTTVERGSSTTYTCSHLLTEFGPYNNSATVTAKKTPGTGPPITQTSNTVVVNVPPEPSFSITKLQEIAGSNAGFTTSPLLGQVGQTINYEIVVTNTGNVPLFFGGFSDEKCESVTGGPGAGSIAPGASTTYFCQHLLTEAKAYSNTARVTGTPPVGDGPPTTNTSNPVVVVTNPSETGTEEGEHGVVTATCSYVSVTYRNFPNLPNNTVTQTLTIHGAAVSKTKFTFNGPTGTDIVGPIVVPPGTGVVDIHASWSTNGSVGHFDIGVSLECPPEPEFTITKLQELSGSNAGFTTAQLTGEVGQTVNYEIVVKNTGNVPLTLSNFTDEGCGPVSGGTAKLLLHASTTYLCSHMLSGVGTYSNSASVTARRSPPSGPTVTHTSNVVEVNVS